MTTQQIKEIIKKELPDIFRKDVEIRKFVLKISSEQFADKTKTEDRFDKLLAELKKDREEQSKKWEEQKAEDNKKWEEQNEKWWEQNEKWWEQNEKWWKQNKKLEKTDKRIEKLECTLGAIGARWGIYTEESFRNALKEILEENFDIEVINVNEFDNDGEVFGRPDQIELDIIIKNGLLIICEIKSSISKSDVIMFHRKIKFYEKQYNRKSSSIIIISPMVDAKAKTVANELGIKVYSHAQDVNKKIFSGKKH